MLQLERRRTQGWRLRNERQQYGCSLRHRPL